jgi:hypothetical protein
MHRVEYGVIQDVKAATLGASGLDKNPDSPPCALAGSRGARAHSDEIDWFGLSRVAAVVSSLYLLGLP